MILLIEVDKSDGEMATKPLQQATTAGVHTTNGFLPVASESFPERGVEKNSSKAHLSGY